MEQPRRVDPGDLAAPDFLLQGTPTYQDQLSRAALGGQNLPGIERKRQSLSRTRRPM